jgi:hypothetical protein
MSAAEAKFVKLFKTVYPKEDFLDSLGFPSELEDKPLALKKLLFLGMSPIMVRLLIIVMWH